MASASSAPFESPSSGSDWLRSYLRPPPLSEASQDPVLHGDGPPECSSCTELSVQPVHIWDVNGYYRELHVPTDATRRELRLAYYAIGGENSHRLTYILKQLLNPEVRRAYDLTPLGELFQDEYVHAMLRRKMQAEMARRMAWLAEQGVDTSNVDKEQMQREIYAEMGLTEVPDTPGETVDEDASGRKDDPDRPAKFEYSFYLWRTRLRDEALGRSILAQWQQHLVTALSREGVSLRFAVGLHGEPSRWVQGLIGYRTVFFLNIAEPPTEELARDVALRVRLDRDRPASLLAKR